MKLSEFLKALSNEIKIEVWEETTDNFIGEMTNNNHLIVEAASAYTVVWFKPFIRGEKIIIDVTVRKEED